MGFVAEADCACVERDALCGVLPRAGAFVPSSLFARFFCAAAEFSGVQASTVLFRVEPVD